MYGVVAKQDRTPVRTPANIEQKYDLDKDFAQIEQMAVNAQKTANAANFTANSASKVASDAQKRASETYTMAETLTEATKAMFELGANAVPNDVFATIFERLNELGGALPSGYTLLEYIESNGTQYIDTGFTPNQNTRLVLDFATLKASGEQHISSARTSGGTPLFVLFWSGSAYGTRYGTSAAQNFSGFGVGRHTINKNKNVTTIDGVTTITANYETFTVGCTLPLFCRNDGSAQNCYTTGRIYSCQIYDNDTIVRDFVPCINPDGEYGLYDKVNKTFYGNAGTGSFTGA